ncbi:hypothetical protein N7461_000874 [Penicillium sp. DV-2018c]|nr:hypothetical protein N7461_000874 [Penicillium sp. DV-2018c]
MASGGGPISNDDSPAPGGPTTVLQSRPPGAGPFLAASRRPAPLKTEGFALGRSPGCPASSRGTIDGHATPSPGAGLSFTHLGGLPPRHKGPPLAPGQVAEMLCQLLGDHRRSHDPVPRELVNLLRCQLPGDPRRSHNPAPRELANLTPTATSFSSGSKIHQTKRAKQASKGVASNGIPQRFTDGKWIVLKPASGFKPHEDSFLHVVKGVSEALAPPRPPVP